MTIEETTSAPSRRLVVQGGAAVLAAGAGFAAYRGWESEPGTGAATSANAYGSRPLVALDQVPVGGGVVLAEERVVVTRDAQGEVHAFSAVCTHQSCLVGGVEGGLIVCPCHGSAFDATSGRVARGPASADLAAVPVAVDGDTVVAQ